MTTEDDGVNWTVYRAELPNLPAIRSCIPNYLMARICGARVRLLFWPIEKPTADRKLPA
jgi:hypothetical protein